MSKNNLIVDKARESYRKYRKPTSSQKTGNAQARDVEAKWSSSLKHAKRYEPQVRVLDRKAIDFVDTIGHSAFELKMSGKNPEHEFYKDIFKVLIYNQNQTQKRNRLKKLVFLTEKKGIVRLSSKFPQAVVDLLKNLHALDVEFVPLD